MTDLSLVRRILAGEEAALREFFEASFPALYRFARARLRGDADAAEEVAQATLTNAVAKLHTYRGEAALLTWLFTFCRHEIAACVARRHRAGETVELVEDSPEIRAALESLQALVVGPEEQLDRSDLVRRVWVALDALPARYGDALEWKYIDGLSVQEIGERLGGGTKAAESVLSRARAAFREAFAAAAPLREERQS